LLFLLSAPLVLPRGQLSLLCLSPIFAHAQTRAASEIRVPSASAPQSRNILPKQDRSVDIPKARRSGRNTALSEDVRVRSLASPELVDGKVCHPWLAATTILAPRTTPTVPIIIVPAMGGHTGFSSSPLSSQLQFVLGCDFIQPPSPHEGQRPCLSSSLLFLLPLADRFALQPRTVSKAPPKRRDCQRAKALGSRRQILVSSAAAEDIDRGPFSAFCDRSPRMACRPNRAASRWSTRISWPAFEHRGAPSPHSFSSVPRGRSPSPTSPLFRRWCLWRPTISRKFSQGRATGPELPSSTICSTRHHSEDRNGSV